MASEIHEVAELIGLSLSDVAVKERSETGFRERIKTGPIWGERRAYGLLGLAICSTLT